MIRLADALSGSEERLRRAHLRERPVDEAPEHPGPPVHALFVYNCNPAGLQL